MIRLNLNLRRYLWAFAGVLAFLGWLGVMEAQSQPASVVNGTGVSGNGVATTSDRPVEWVSVADQIARLQKSMNAIEIGVLMVMFLQVVGIGWVLYWNERWIKEKK